MMNQVVEQPTINLQLAQAYVPYQQYRNLYNVNEALYKGTIFQDLFRAYKNPYKK